MLFFSCRGEADSNSNKSNVVSFSGSVFALGLLPHVTTTP